MNRICPNLICSANNHLYKRRRDKIKGGCCEKLTKYVYSNEECFIPFLVEPKNYSENLLEIIPSLQILDIAKIIIPYQMTLKLIFLFFY